MALAVGGLLTSHLFRELSYLGQTFAYELLFEGEVAPVCFPSAFLSSTSFLLYFNLPLWLLPAVFHSPLGVPHCDFQEGSAKFLSFNSLHWSISFPFLFWAVLCAGFQGLFFSPPISPCFLAQTFVFLTHSHCNDTSEDDVFCVCQKASILQLNPVSFPRMPSGYLKSTPSFGFICPCLAWLYFTMFHLWCAFLNSVNFSAMCL